jgi:hypothetical protein
LAAIHDEGGRVAGLVAHIRDVQVAGRVRSKTVNVAQSGIESRAVVAAVTRRSVSGHRRDHAVRNPPDTTVARIHKVHVAGGVDRNTLWGVQLGLDGRAIVAAETTEADMVHRGSSDSRHRRDDVILAKHAIRGDRAEKNRKQQTHSECSPLRVGFVLCDQLVGDAPIVFLLFGRASPFLTSGKLLHADRDFITRPANVG